MPTAWVGVVCMLASQPDSLLLRQGGVMRSVLLVCPSVCQSLCYAVSKRIHQCVYGCRPNMGSGDPVELIKFWCWSGSGCRAYMYASSSVSNYNNYGLIRYIVTRQGAPPCFTATVQRPRQSLRSLEIVCSCKYIAIKFSTWYRDGRSY